MLRIEYNFTEEIDGLRNCVEKCNQNVREETAKVCSICTEKSQLLGIPRTTKKVLQIY